MHTYFVTHVTTEAEIDKLPKLLESLLHYFPNSSVLLFNQSGVSFPKSEMAIACENTKECGFGWTLRFLRYASGVMEPGDLLIKIDPDTEIQGNPIAGLQIPDGSFFGQQDKVGCCDMVFFGGFQGYTYKAMQEILRFGPQWENITGPQDVVLQQIVHTTLQPFIPLEGVQLWLSRDEPLPEGLKVVHYKRVYA